MLKLIERNELPSKRRGEKSPVRIFAEQTIAEFEEMVRGHEVAEVTGWPVDKERDAIWNAARARSEISNALFYMDRESDARKRIKVSRSGCRVFMERTAPYRTKPNPYPGDMPRVQ